MIIYYNELGKKGLEPSNYLKSYFEYDAYKNSAIRPFFKIYIIQQEWRILSNIF